MIPMWYRVAREVLPTALLCLSIYYAATHGAPDWMLAFSGIVVALRVVAIAIRVAECEWPENPE